MPELPDIIVYIEALERRLAGATLERVRLASPFLLRSATPPLASAHGREVKGLRRLGKRIAFELDGELFLVLHLMIAGRLRWRPAGEAIPRKLGLAAFDFSSGTLVLTEAGTKHRASLHVVAGQHALQAMTRSGLEVLSSGQGEFKAALRRENHTLKRALTDPDLFSGIGNAYSDEILHRARLSPVKLTSKLSDEEAGRLYEAAKLELQEWTDRLRRDAGEGFPERVTAFHEQMRVHGRYGKPCPDCGSPVQRIVSAQVESSYCATCQTDGKLLADRALSKLLKGDWPRTLEELEERVGRGQATK